MPTQAVVGLAILVLEVPTLVKVTEDVGVEELAEDLVELVADCVEEELETPVEL